MKIGFYNYYTFANKNRMFLSSDSPIGDELSYPMFYMGKSLKSRGLDFSTIDIDDINSYDIVIFLDLPRKNDPFFVHLKNYHKNLYLVLLESPLIRPENWDVNNHKVFKKVFVWNDEYLGSNKYVKFFIPVKIRTSFPDETDRKLCTIISSNKMTVKSINELYTERIRAIRWFENNHPLEFDLYGIGWNAGEPMMFLKKFIERNKTIVNIYSKIKNISVVSPLLNPFHLHFPSYKGEVESKHQILTKYKFSICYENASDLPGYITEKIFDCFYAGTIPVYLGAKDICEYVPSNAFIDKRNFNTYEELYSFMKNMPEAVYKSYLEGIRAYLRSDAIQNFSAETFTNIILNNILGE